MHLVFEQVGDIVGVLRFAQTAFAAVTGDVFTPAGKVVDSETAGIGTATALRHGGGEFQMLDLVKAKHGRSLAFVTFPCDQRSAEGAHDTGNIGTYSFTVRNLFEGTQYGIVIEGATLNYDMLTQFGSIRYLDHLKQCVLDNRISQTGRDISNGCAFLLGLLYFGVHKYGTAGTQIDGVLCKECCLGEVLHAVV